jgi:hypothetical protein
METVAEILITAAVALVVFLSAALILGAALLGDPTLKRRERK